MTEIANPKPVDYTLSYAFCRIVSMLNNFSVGSFSTSTARIWPAIQTAPGQPARFGGRACSTPSRSIRRSGHYILAIAAHRLRALKARLHGLISTTIYRVQCARTHRALLMHMVP